MQSRIIFTELWMFVLNRSLMNRTEGDRTEPCGTLLFISLWVENVLYHSGRRKLEMKVELICSCYSFPFSLYGIYLFWISPHGALHLYIIFIYVFDLRARAVTLHKHKLYVNILPVKHLGRIMLLSRGKKRLIGLMSANKNSFKVW